MFLVADVLVFTLLLIQINVWCALNGINLQIAGLEVICDEKYEKGQKGEESEKSQSQRKTCASQKVVRAAKNPLCFRRILCCDDFVSRGYKFPLLSWISSYASFPVLKDQHNLHKVWK